MVGGFLLAGHQRPKIAQSPLEATGGQFGGLVEGLFHFFLAVGSQQLAQPFDIFERLTVGQVLLGPVPGQQQ